MGDRRQGTMECGMLTYHPEGLDEQYRVLIQTRSGEHKLVRSRRRDATRMCEHAPDGVEGDGEEMPEQQERILRDSRAIDMVRKDVGENRQRREKRRTRIGVIRVR